MDFVRERLLSWEGPAASERDPTSPPAQPLNVSPTATSDVAALLTQRNSENAALKKQVVALEFKLDVARSALTERASTVQNNISGNSDDAAKIDALRRSALSEAAAWREQAERLTDELEQYKIDSKAEIAEAHVRSDREVRAAQHENRILSAKADAVQSRSEEQGRDLREARSRISDLEDQLSLAKRLQKTAHSDVATSPQHGVVVTNRADIDASVQALRTERQRNVELTTQLEECQAELSRLRVVTETEALLNASRNSGDPDALGNVSPTPSAMSPGRLASSLALVREQLQCSEELAMRHQKAAVESNHRAEALAAELTHIQTRLTDVETSLSSARGHKRMLETSVADLQAANEGELRRLARAVATLSQERDALRSEITSVSTVVDGARAEVTGRLDALRRRADEAESQLQQQREQNTELNHRYMTSVSERDGLRDEVDRLRQELMQLSNTADKVATTDNRIDPGQVARYAGELAAKDGEVQRCEARLRHTTQRLEAIERELDTVRSSAAARETEGQQRLDLARADHQRAVAATVSANADLKVSEARCGELRAQLLDLQGEVGTLRAQSANCDDETARAWREAERLGESLASCEVRARTAESEARESSKTIDDLRLECSELRGRLEGEAARCESAMTRMEATERRHTREMSAVTASFESAKDEIARLKQTVDSERERGLEASAARRRAEEELDGLRDTQNQTMSQLESSVVEKDDLLSSVKHRQKTLLEQLSERNSRIDELERDCAALAADVRDRNRAAVEAADRCVELERRCEALTADVARARADTSNRMGRSAEFERELEEQLSAARTAATTAGSRAAALEVEAANARATVRRVEAAAAADRDRLTASIDEAKAEADTERRTTASLREELRQAHEQVGTLRSRAQSESINGARTATMAEQLEEVELSLERERTRNSELEQQASEMEKSSARLIREMRRQMERADAVAEEERKATSELRARLARAHDGDATDNVVASAANDAHIAELETQVRELKHQLEDATVGAEAALALSLGGQVARGYANPAPPSEDAHQLAKLESDLAHLQLEKVGLEQALAEARSAAENASAPPTEDARVAHLEGELAEQRRMYDGLSQELSVLAETMSENERAMAEVVTERDAHAARATDLLARLSGSMPSSPAKGVGGVDMSNLHMPPTVAALEKQLDIERRLSADLGLQLERNTRKFAQATASLRKAESRAQTAETSLVAANEQLATAVAKAARLEAAVLAAANTAAAPETDGAGVGVSASFTETSSLISRPNPAHNKSNTFQTPSPQTHVTKQPNTSPFTSRSSPGQQNQQNPFASSSPARSTSHTEPSQPQASPFANANISPMAAPSAIAPTATTPAAGVTSMPSSSSQQQQQQQQQPSSSTPDGVTNRVLHVPWKGDLRFSLFWNALCAQGHTGWAAQAGACPDAECCPRLMRLVLAHGTAYQALLDAVMIEIPLLNNAPAHALFRGQSSFTRLWGAAVQATARSWLGSTLGPILLPLCQGDDGTGHSLEVDPTRVSQDDASRNVEELRLISASVVSALANNGPKLPYVLRRVAFGVDAIVQSTWPQQGEQASKSVMATLLVLRLICPAIASPHRFGIVEDTPTPQVSRTFALLAKIIQVTANSGVQFGQKEPYMTAFNQDLAILRSSLQKFLGAAASVGGEPNEPVPNVDDGDVSAMSQCMGGGMPRVEAMIEQMTSSSNDAAGAAASVMSSLRTELHALGIQASTSVGASSLTPASPQRPATNNSMASPGAASTSATSSPAQPSQGAGVATSPSDSSIQIEGYLEKYSKSMFRSWSKRFFVLTPRGLQYFSTRESWLKGEAPSFFMLNHVTATESMVKGKHAILLTANGQYEAALILGVSDFPERSRWLRALQASCEANK